MGGVRGVAETNFPKLRLYKGLRQKSSFPCFVSQRKRIGPEETIPAGGHQGGKRRWPRSPDSMAFPGLFGAWEKVLFRGALGKVVQVYRPDCRYDTAASSIARRRPTRGHVSSSFTREGR